MDKLLKLGGRFVKPSRSPAEQEHLIECTCQEDQQINGSTSTGRAMLTSQVTSVLVWDLQIVLQVVIKVSSSQRMEND